MILLTELAGLLGPFDAIELLDDRAVCDGAHVPFAVVGNCSVLDIEVPSGHRAEEYNLVDGSLVPKNP